MRHYKRSVRRRNGRKKMLKLQFRLYDKGTSTTEASIRRFNIPKKVEFNHIIQISFIKTMIFCFRTMDTFRHLRDTTSNFDSSSIMSFSSKIRAL
ncbi:hypothetical protein FQR65_LT01760 [Abscondita terminalis]|nr:hypothetical protein FQR65_LT01760 [Abscondita terminalis]